MLVSQYHLTKKVDNDQNKDENTTQMEVQIESGPQSLRKIECTHCKKLYLHMNINCRILIYVPMIYVNL